MPEALAKAADWSRLSLDKTGSLTDPQGASLTTDLFYTVPLHGDHGELSCPLGVRVLFEHQSTVDPLMAFRLLKYVVARWDKFLEQNPKSKRLPPIVSVVLYHGKRPWRAPQGIQEMVQAALMRGG